METLRRNIGRDLRSSRVQKGLGFALLVFVLALGAAHELGFWQADNLLGTARWEARPPEILQRVSLNRLGIEGNSDSFSPSISADGRLVVYLSTADNLVPDDSNGFQDVFLYDRAADEISRLTVAFDGAEVDGASSDAHISRDGRYVVFVSEASNLVASDDNGYADVFLLERASGQIRRVSVAADGTQGDNRSLQPAISADGRFVSFVSLAENLSEDDDNDMSDVYVYDGESGALEMVSVNDQGEQANATSKHAAISADGRYVVFQSKATNLVQGDGNNMYDIFLHDRQQGITELVSGNLEGGVGNMESQRPSISDDGRYVVFESWANDLVSRDDNYQSDVFVADRQTGRIELVSVGNEGQQADHVNGGAVISGDGRYVAFSSLAGNLAANDDNQLFDVYLRDRLNGNTSLISIGMSGKAGNGASISPSLTAGGDYIVFDSVATDLVANDSNERVDVFIFNAPGVEGRAPRTVYLPFASGS